MFLRAVPQPAPPVATLTARRVHQGKVRNLRIFEPTAYYSIDYIDQAVKRLLKGAHLAALLVDPL